MTTSLKAPRHEGPLEAMVWFDIFRCWYDEDADDDDFRFELSIPTKSTPSGNENSVSSL